MGADLPPPNRAAAPGARRPDRRAREAAAWAGFARMYARKAQKRAEPNDRRFDRAFQRRARRMKPEALAALLGADGGEED